MGLARPYRVPSQTVLLGAVLDVQFEDDSGSSRVTIADWEGWALLTDANAMDRAPGRARLYLCPFDARGQFFTREKGAKAAETYLRWHQRHPERSVELEVPDAMRFRQGRAIRIGYASDKWHRRGAVEHYEHDFREDGGRCPILYTDTRDHEDAAGAVIVGGDMRVTERGID